MGTAHLTAKHLKELKDGSNIIPAMIEQRGYRSVTIEDHAEFVAMGFGKDQIRLPGLFLPIRTVDGQIDKGQLKPDTPRTKDGKPIKYETPAGWKMRLDVPTTVLPMLKDPSKTLWITEGIKKADSGAVQGLCIIALIGVWNWRGTNEFGGLTELADWEAIALKKRKIYIAFDSDVMLKPEVAKALKRLAAFLRRKGASEVIPIVPRLAKLGPDAKIGVDDFFAAGGTRMELEACARPDILHHGRQVVVNGRPLGDICEDALAAVVETNFPPTVFVRGGELVRVVSDERDIPRIDTFTLASLRGHVARAASWVRRSKESDTECAPPKEVIEDMMALPNWPDIPSIETVTKAPVLARNGRISLAPGYCPDSRFYIATSETWPTWEGSVKEAVDYIFDDVLADFPFASDADRAHALALMLLPIVRPTIDGPTPLHLIDAPVQGSGKSLLAKVCLMVTAGSTISTTTGPRDEEEWRKKITSHLLQGRTYILFDNLSHKIASEALEGVLTATEWEDRLLSVSKIVTLPVRCIWLATTNNAELSRDILRRTVWIRIDPQVERPEDRTEFKHRHIEKWITTNRPTIISALVAIVSSWVDKGSKMFVGTPLGSFEHWSLIVGGILQSAGVEGFLSNVDALREAADPERLAWAGFLERWWERYEELPCKAGELLEMFKEDEELAGALFGKSTTSDTSRLGFLLKKRVGVVFRGLRIAKSASSHGRSAAYKLERIGEGCPPFGEGLGAQNHQPSPNSADTNGEGMKNELGSNGEGCEGLSDLNAHARVRARDQLELGGKELQPSQPSPNPDLPSDDDEEGEWIV